MQKFSFFNKTKTNIVKESESLENIEDKKERFTCI